MKRRICQLTAINSSVNSWLSTCLSILKTHSCETTHLSTHGYQLICQLMAVNASVNSRLSTRMSTHCYQPICQLTASNSLAAKVCQSSTEKLGFELNGTLKHLGISYSGGKPAGNNVTWGSLWLSWWRHGYVLRCRFFSLLVHSNSSVCRPLL